MSAYERESLAAEAKLAADRKINRQAKTCASRKLRKN